MENKNYQDLSRRALIKLNTDFDNANNNALLKYLNDKLEENPNTYESIRIPERIIVVADKTATEVKHIGEDIIDKSGTIIARITENLADSALTFIKSKIF